MRGLVFFSSMDSHLFSIYMKCQCLWHFWGPHLWNLRNLQRSALPWNQTSYPNATSMLFAASCKSKLTILRHVKPRDFEWNDAYSFLHVSYFGFTSQLVRYFRYVYLEVLPHTYHFICKFTKLISLWLLICFLLLKILLRVNSSLEFHIHNCLHLLVMCASHT